MSPSKLRFKMGNDIFQLCYDELLVTPALDLQKKLSSCNADDPDQFLPSIPESSVLQVGANKCVKIIHGGVSGGIAVSIYCNIGESSMKALGVRRDSHKISLVGIDAGDEHQQWDLQHSTHGSIVKGEEHRKFVVVNKATGLALWKSRGKEDQYYALSLMKFDGRYQDDSALWKEGRFAKQGLRRIYAADNECYLNVDDAMANNVLLQKDEKHFLKFGGSSGTIWKIVHLP